MKKAVIIIVVLAIVGIGAYYIFSNKSSTGTPAYTYPPVTNRNTNTPTPSTAAPKTSISNTPKATTTPKITMTPQATPLPSVAVSISNFSFNPPTLRIKTGTKVTWVNNDSVSHTVTSDSGNLLNSPTLSPGQSFSFTFTDPGSTTYHCSIHPMMKGGVVVTNQ